MSSCGQQVNVHIYPYNVANLRVYTRCCFLWCNSIYMTLNDYYPFWYLVQNISGWWPGPLHCQINSDHGLCYVGYMGHCLMWRGSTPSAISVLTLNMQGPSYLGLTRSISWQLMPWLLTSPGHQQPWYWLYRICRSWSYLRKDFKHMWSDDIKCKYMFPPQNLTRKELRNYRKWKQKFVFSKQFCK